MIGHFERLGGKVRVGDPVVSIDMLGERVTGVTCVSGWHGDFDAAASNADVMHSYRDLLSNSPRGPKAARALAAKRFSPSLFVVHFGVEGTFPEIPHHSILFGPRYKALLSDIYDRGLLAEDFSLYLHHASISDPALAPPGCSTFYALAPVPHLGKLPFDWDAHGEVYADRILDHLEARVIPDLRARLVTRFHYTPTDFGRDLNAHLGSAFSLEPLLTQSAFFRVHNRDDRIANLYFVGAGTHPGAGIPGVIGSARATAALMVEDLAGA
jgi:phytoene desaturase